MPLCCNRRTVELFVAYLSLAIFITSTVFYFKTGEVWRIRLITVVILSLTTCGMCFIFACIQRPYYLIREEEEPSILGCGTICSGLKRCFTCLWNCPNRCCSCLWVCLSRCFSCLWVCLSRCFSRRASNISDIGNNEPPTPTTDELPSTDDITESPSTDITESSTTDTLLQRKEELETAMLNEATDTLMQQKEELETAIVNEATEALMQPKEELETATLSEEPQELHVSKTMSIEDESDNTQETKL